MLFWMTGDKMARVTKALKDTSIYAAALEGLELQKQRIEEQIQQVRALLGARRVKSNSPSGPAAEKPARKRRLSAAARNRIAQAQKRRWAEYRKAQAASA
jgi:hypothetical protein